METTYWKIKRENIDLKCERDQWKESSKFWKNRVVEILEDCQKENKGLVKVFKIITFLAFTGWIILLLTFIF